MSIKILYYLNQFFGQKGGEEMAHIGPELVDGQVGPSAQVHKSLAGKAEVVKTIICGDSWFNENEEAAEQFISETIDAVKPDLIVAGPAFNAGRYGMACGRVGEIAKEKGVTTITGMYVENPGYDLFKNFSYMVQTTNSAGGMRKALPAMIKLVESFIAKDGKLGMPAEEGYMPRGLRINMFAEKRGAARAVEMLIAKLEGAEFETEYAMPTFDRVEPFAAIKSLANAKIAMVTSGGVVPKGNPDRIESSSASKYGEYDISDFATLTEADHETAHGGYDPVACNEDPNRVLPVDVLRAMEKEGKLGELHNKFYSTVGNGTATSSSKAYGAEIAQRMLDAGVSAAIMTST